ncbi:amino acid ABC transporter permease [Microvirga massiliensis]|uniref:amino acid ABC transporter permease n=1 Tax=Microvirga massiliensis TaxID=1033741 RepID=UPI00062B92D9|nr:amino acid ABC transporter permease [Microvirga massiliensis]
MLERLAQELPGFLGYYNVIFVAQAALTTLALSAIGCLIGTVMGLALVLVRLMRGRLWAPLRWIAILFIEFFRRVPFLVTLMLAFFAFQLSGADLPLFVVAAVSVCLIGSAFLAEIIRAGFESVHRNQWDAAAAMNFGLLDTVRYVVLPQAWRVILPPAFGFFVLFIKDTALASQIGVVELTFAAKVLNNKGFSAALVFGTILVVYFAISYPLARLGAHLEVRLAPSRHRRP